MSRPGSTHYTITITRSGGFTGSLSLRVSGLPNRTSGSFSPSSIASGATSSTLNITTSNHTSRGSYTLTVTATSGSLSHNTSVALTVQ